MLYEAYRMKSELAFYNVLGINETLRILQSPAAGVYQLERIVDFLKVWTWGEEIERGTNAGKTRFRASAEKVIPFWRTIERLMAPEDQVNWYKR